MQNDKSTELLRNKLEGLDALSGGIVFGKEDAWEKLQQRIERKPARRIAIRWLTAAAVVLLMVTIFIALREPTIQANNVVMKNEVQQASAPVKQQASATETISAVATTPPNAKKHYRAPIKPIEQKQQPEAETVKNEPLGNEGLLFSTVNTAPPPVTLPQPAKKMRIIHISELNNGDEAQSQQTVVAVGNSTLDVSKLPLVHINDVVHEEYQVRLLLEENRLGVERQFMLWKNRADAGNSRNEEDNILYRPRNRQRQEAVYQNDY